MIPRRQEFHQLSGRSRPPDSCWLPERWPPFGVDTEGTLMCGDCYLQTATDKIDTFSDRPTSATGTCILPVGNDVFMHVCAPLLTHRFSRKATKHEMNNPQ